MDDARALNSLRAAHQRNKTNQKTKQNPTTYRVAVKRARLDRRRQVLHVERAACVGRRVARKPDAPQRERSQVAAPPRHLRHQGSGVAVVLIRNVVLEHAVLHHRDGVLHHDGAAAARAVGTERDVSERDAHQVLAVVRL